MTTPAQRIEQRIEAMSGTEYMGQVKRLGCLCCRLRGIPDTPASAHHPRKFGGLRDLLDKWTIPLCEFHHTVGPEAIHRIRRRVEQVWGMSEQQMAEQTRKDVAALLACDVRFARAA